MDQQKAVIDLVRKNYRNFHGSFGSERERNFLYKKVLSDFDIYKIAKNRKNERLLARSIAFLPTAKPSQKAIFFSSAAGVSSIIFGTNLLVNAGQFSFFMIFLDLVMIIIGFELIKKPDGHKLGYLTVFSFVLFIIFACYFLSLNSNNVLNNYFILGFQSFTLFLFSSCARLAMASKMTFLIGNPPKKIDNSWDFSPR